MADLKLLGVSLSPYSRRVEIALKMKGVEYEYVEEDLQKKSELLLQYNPVHKKVPVLVHGGKPIAESLIILEYIDETWKTNPILPTDPYHRAQARFWARFFDDKLIPSVTTALMSSQEEREKARGEAREMIVLLEKEIEGKKFFGGDEIGIVDIVGTTVAYWLPVIQEAAGEHQLPASRYPAICAWTERLLACPVIRESLPPREKLLAAIKARFAADAAKR